MKEAIPRHVLIEVQKEGGIELKDKREEEGEKEQKDSSDRKRQREREEEVKTDGSRR